MKVKEKRIEFHSDSIKNVWNNKRLLYKRINQLLGKSKKNLLPEEDPGQHMANKFGCFFVEKVTKIRNDIKVKLSKFNDDEDDVCSACQCNTEFSSFKQITLEDLGIIFSTMNNKFCSLDPIPTNLLSECFSEIGHVIVNIINQSISQGIMPESLKNAVVKPVFKNLKEDINAFSNYRPVSNISFLSKLIEKAVLWQIDSYLNEYNLYCTNQSGYRALHSCETLNLLMFNTILQEIDSGKVVAVFLLDMSAAFDTIDHNLLLETLHNAYGFKGTVLNWFSSYLSNRKFSVSVDQHSSELMDTVYGVPQGSILGPVLFILYTKHLQHIAEKHHIHTQMYADDTQLYVSFDPRTNCDSFYSSVETCLSEINNWLTKQFLKLNESNTKLILLCKPSVRKLFQDYNHQFAITLNNSQISEVNWSNEKVKSLGIYLDPDLTMTNHVLYLKKFCVGKLMEWKRIRTFLSEKTRLLLVKQIILAKFDYNNVLFIGLPKHILNDLQFVINCAIRFIYKLKYRDHVTPYLKRAHILPISYRIDHKVCVIVFNCFHGLAPEYLRDILVWNTPKYFLTEGDILTTYLNSGVSAPRMSNDRFLLKYNSCFGNKTRCISRSFADYAPRCWNRLPYAIRSIKNKQSFLKCLKTHFFNIFLDETFQ